MIHQNKTLCGQVEGGVWIRELKGWVSTADFAPDSCVFHFYFYHCANGGTLWHLQKFSNVSNISHLNSPPPSFCYPSSPIPGIVSAGVIFQFTYMCTQYLHHIHPPTHFPTSPHHWYHPPRQNLFCPPVL
jgi:hypothetical protein